MLSMIKDEFAGEIVQNRPYASAAQIIMKFFYREER
jgi:hypothetical protein